MKLASVALLSALAATPALGLDWNPSDDVYLRVVDVGPGLCVVAVAPGGHLMLYDGGRKNWQCYNAVKDLAPVGSTIDLVVISHSDSDHLGDLPRILKDYEALRILWSGDRRPDEHPLAATRAQAFRSIDSESSATVIDLGSSPTDMGAQIALGPAMVTFIAGWGRWEDTAGLDGGEIVNAISVVVKLEYRGRSVLLTGDTVGRHRDDPDEDACGYAEKAMVDNAGDVPLKVDVMTVPHHGGNNGSTPCFIAAVDPDFVIFSAGSQYQHPAKDVAERYLSAGVAADKMFRTDLGDDESGSFEWKQGSVAGCNAPVGDDDVEIVLRKSGSVAVAYRAAHSGC